MTILAGVVARRADRPVPDDICRDLRVHISRNAGDRRIEYRDDGAFFIKVDIGAFACPAHQISAAGSWSMLAGEPLLVGEEIKNDGRDAHLAFLHARLDEDDSGSLSSASGTFCGAYYDPRERRARLFTDRLGLRPLYYAVIGDFVYFTTALRVFEALSQIPKTMAVLAVVEMTGFGYPFGAGTPYANVRVLQPCEIVTIHRDRVESSRYFHWDAIAPVNTTEEEALEEAFRRFQGAVRRRLRADRTTLAYLSGGLDSRCVVAAVRAEGAAVHTFNFSLPNTQDQVFGLEFANRIASIHHELPTEPNPDWSQVMAQAVQLSPRVRENRPERPNLVWSGEGGSVGLGHVYLAPEIVSLLREHNRSRAIDVFLRQQKKRILTRILQPALVARLKGYLQARLYHELEEIHYPDPVRSLHIFLNLNGPRRHLEGHFDSIDEHRIELQMPFNDSNLVEYITSIPIDACLYHNFYVRWLSHFDHAVLEVPWQAYPGHKQSPVPIPANLLDQWTASESESHRLAIKADLLNRSRVMLSSAGFPRPILRKTHLRLMHLAWKFNVANYGYALNAALTYDRFWKKSSGRFEISPPRH